MSASRTTLLAALLLLVLTAWLPAGTVRAQEPPPQEGEPPEDEPPGLIEQIVRHILIFPVETMQAATETLLVNMLQRNAEGIRSLFSGLVADLTLQNPGIKAPSDSLVWRGVDIFAPTWNFTVKIAVALWPATLAITAATAAQGAATSTDWGIAGLKGALAQWVGGVLACAFSLEIIDLANRLSNAIIGGIVGLPIRGAIGLNVEAIVNALLGAALRVFGMGVSPAAAIVAVLVELVLGLALVISIIGQYFARVALLYVVVALAPIVLVLGILRPARWLQWLWLKGLLLVMLLGPITALLFKLILALHVAIINPVLSFLMVVGVTSVLLAVNGAVISGVFGAAAEVVGKAWGTATGVMRGAATAVAVIGGAALSGGAALGVLPGVLAGGGGGAAVSGAGASAGGAGAGTAAAGVVAGGTSAGGATGSAAGAARPGSPPAFGASARSSRPAAAAAREWVWAAAAGAGPDAPASQPGTDGGEGTAGSAGDGEPQLARESGPSLGASGAPESRTGPGFLDRLRQRWHAAAPHERAEAAGSAMRTAGAALGGRSLAGRTIGAVGAGLQAGTRAQAENLEAQGARPAPGRPGPRSGSAARETAINAPSADAHLAALSPDEIGGYRQAMRDIRRDLRTPMEAAGLDLRQVERDALAPVWAAAQHDTMTNVARQAGFGDRGDTASVVGDFVAYRIEGQLMAQGFLSQRITRPGAPPVVPLSDTPALIDYDRGQQIAWAARGGDMATYAGLHHAIRRHADTPRAGLDAATGFYNAAVESRGVAGVIEAAREHAAQAGVPQERLEPWLQQLQSA